MRISDVKEPTYKAYDLGTSLLSRWSDTCAVSGIWVAIRIRRSVSAPVPLRAATRGGTRIVLAYQYLGRVGFANFSVGLCEVIDLEQSQKDGEACTENHDGRFPSIEYAFDIQDSLVSYFPLFHV